MDEWEWNSGYSRLVEGAVDGEGAQDVGAIDGEMDGAVADVLVGVAKQAGGLVVNFVTDCCEIGEAASRHVDRELSILLVCLNSAQV